MIYESEFIPPQQVTVVLSHRRGCPAPRRQVGDDLCGRLLPLLRQDEEWNDRHKTGGKGM